MKRLVGMILLVGLIFGFAADSTFPEITGQTLNGKTVTLPRDAKGEYTLVGVAYSLKAKDDLEGWIEPVYKQFTDNPMFPAKVYFVPMTANIKQYSDDKMISMMKQALDKQFYDKVVVYTGSPESYVKSLSMSEKDKPYFFVLNPEGKIIHKEMGAYSEAKLEAITDVMDGEQ